MNEPVNPNFQYNSCISKGICSVNPKTSALQSVLGVYLYLCAKYCLDLQKQNLLDDKIRTFMLNAAAISIANQDLSETSFWNLITEFKSILPKLVDKYNSIFGKNEFKESELSETDIFKRCSCVIDSIKFGEEISRIISEKTDSKIRDLYKIMLVVVKSMSINLIDLESFGIKHNDGFYEILKLLSTFNFKENSEITLKEHILSGVNCDIELMHLLHSEQEKRYGSQITSKVSYTTTPAKAVLFIGSNIRELETALEQLKDSEIDVYTHDEMMVAHTFPKFKEYKNLKGQFGQGLENCLLDFATFPGPIVLTKHSLHNIENLYRGRLYTTDINFHKGIIKIENNDYSDVIKSANESKGFKKGKECDTVSVGYNFSEIKSVIDKKLSKSEFKNILVIGLKDYTIESSEYYKKLIKLASDKTLIISFSYESNRENFIHINACFDSFAVLNVIEFLFKYNLPVKIFMPKCDRNTISKVIYFANKKNTSVYLGECAPIIINPTLRITLKNLFGVEEITCPKQDLKNSFE